MICEGNCKEDHGKHEGEVKTVHVVDKNSGHDWGNFNYCEAAILEDVKRGFKVEVVDS